MARQTLTRRVIVLEAGFLDLRGEMRHGFDTADDRFDEVDRRFDRIEARLDGIDRELVQIRIDMGEMHAQLLERIDRGRDEDRRHMRVLFEELKGLVLSRRVRSVGC